MAKKKKRKYFSEAWVLFDELLSFSRKKYSYPVMPDDLMRRVDKAMKVHKYYLDENLSIDKLCILMQTNRTYLSRSIKIVKGVQFCTYVNSFRIAEAKDLLQKEAYGTYDYETLSAKVGFTSVRSFGRVFKFIEGCTPRQYALMTHFNSED